MVSLFALTKKYAYLKRGWMSDHREVFPKTHPTLALKYARFLVRSFNRSIKKILCHVARKPQMAKDGPEPIRKKEEW